MKLGLSDFIVILVIVGLVLLAFRGIPARGKTSPPPARIRRPSAEEIEEENIKSSRRSRLRFLGGAFVVAGLILLSSALKVLDAFLTLYTGAALIIVAGIFVLFLSTRR